MDYKELSKLSPDRYIEYMTGIKYKWWQRVYIRTDYGLKQIINRLSPNSSYNKLRRFRKLLRKQHLKT